MSDIEQIANRTATGVALAYRRGEATPVELTECLVARIERNAHLNIFISTTIERAMREAEASAKRYRASRPLSPLDGVPIAWKDLLDVAGSRTTGGSSLFRDGPLKDQDQRCVANAAAAGMVCLGKLNMTELAYSGLGLNPHFGTPVNPADLQTHRSPGGSSSGSGAAVASGLVPCAVGTDTGGSVRIPASLNGVYGYKTSEGRLDKTGMIALSRTLDTIGPLARSVEDCAVLDMILRGAVTQEARRTDVKSLRIVVPSNLVFDEADTAVIDNFERSMDVLEKAGAQIERRRVETLDRAVDLTARHGSLVAAEAYHEYHDLIESSKGERIDGRVVHRIVMGRSMTAYDLLTIQNTREVLVAELEDLLSGALLAMPTTPVTAPDIAPLEIDVDRFHEVNLRVLRNTMLGNFLRLCGLAIPNGQDGDNLPTSTLFSAPHQNDCRLLGYGLEIDRHIAPFYEPVWNRV